MKTWSEFKSKMLTEIAKAEPSDVHEVAEKIMMEWAQTLLFRRQLPYDAMVDNEAD